VEEVYKPNFKDLIKNPVNRLVLAGTFFRNFAGSINTYYVPVFFLRNFPAYKTAFSTLQALNLSVFGMISGIVAGLLSDKFETKNKNFMAKALIIILGCAIATPMLAVTTL
jgi:MFS family permease